MTTHAQKVLDVRRISVTDAVVMLKVWHLWGDLDQTMVIVSDASQTARTSSAT